MTMMTNWISTDMAIYAGTPWVKDRAMVMVSIGFRLSFRVIFRVMVSIQSINQSINQELPK